MSKFVLPNCAENFCKSAQSRTGYTIDSGRTFPSPCKKLYFPDVCIFLQACPVSGGLHVSRYHPICFKIADCSWIALFSIRTYLMPAHFSFFCTGRVSREEQSHSMGNPLHCATSIYFGQGVKCDGTLNISDMQFSINL